MGGETSGAGGADSSPVLWGLRAGSTTNADTVEDTAIDSAGNLLVVGQIGGTTSLGCKDLSVSDGADAYIAKLDPNGKCLWSKSFGASGSAQRVFATGVATWPNGDVVMTGFFDGSTNFGSGYLVPKSSFDIYLVKFDRMGNEIWASSYGGAADEWAWDVAVQPIDGAIYVAGHYNQATGQSDLGTGPLPSFGFNDAYVAKFLENKDATGAEPLWARGYGASGNTTESLVSIGLGPGGEIVTAGYISGPVDFDGIETTNQGSMDWVVSRHSPDDGHALWAKSYGSSSDDRARGLTFTDTSVLVAGYFLGEVDFGKGKVTSLNFSRDAYLLELDLQDGKTLWGQQYGGASEDAAYCIAKNSEGGLALGGYFEGMVPEFGPNFTAFDAQDAFVFTLSKTRDITWAAHFGGKANDATHSLAWSSSSTLVAGGQFSNSIDLTQPPLQSQGGLDLFVTRLQVP